MRKVMSLAALFLGFVFVFSACSKYEEGPMVSLKSKEERIAGEYTVSEVYKNGQYDEDMTEEQDGNEYIFNKDGTGSVSGSLEWEGVTFTISGDMEWELSDDKVKLLMRTKSEGEDEWSEWEETTILKLEDEEMWLEGYDDDDNLIEMHYVE
ncbi:MAG: hypothetical protein ACLFM1_05810 [Bacteroidales bacterium]